MNWIKKILMQLYIIDRPIEPRGQTDRRKSERRWGGPDGDKARSLKDPRRRKNRRKKKRRG